MTEVVTRRNVAKNKESSPKTEVEKLLIRYHKEPLLHQRILQIKALLYYVKGKGDFAQGIARSSLRAVGDKKLYPQHLNPILGRLQEKKLLTDDFNCNPIILHVLTALAVSEDNVNASSNLSTLTYFLGYTQEYNAESQHPLSNFRGIHLAVHSNNTVPFLDDRNLQPNYCSALIQDVSSIFYFHSLDLEWVNTRHPVIQLYILCTKMQSFYASRRCLPPDAAPWTHFILNNDFIEIAIKHHLDKLPLLMAQLLQLALAFKPTSYLEQYLPLLDNHYYRCEMEGALAFFSQNANLAIQHYEKANKAFGALLNKQEWFRNNVHGILYVLALLSQELSLSIDSLKKITFAIASLRKIQVHYILSNILEALLNLKRGDRKNAENYHQYAQKDMDKGLTHFPFLSALIDWSAALLEPEKLPSCVPKYQQHFKRYHDIQHYFVAQMYAELTQIGAENDEECHYFLDTLHPYGDFRFMAIMRIKQPWEYAMDQLHDILIDKSAQHANGEKRLVWLVNPTSLSIDIAEQSMRKNGLWSAGKPISLKRLYNGDNKLTYLTPQDTKAISGLRYETYGWHGQVNFYWDKQQTLTSLIGHPLVFHSENRGIALELVKGDITLQVEKIEQGYHFSLSKHSTAPQVFLESETANRYRIIDFSEEAVSICKIIPPQGMTVPFQAKDKIIEMICHAKSTIHIQSDVADDNLPTIAGNATPCAHLFPLHTGLKINLWIRPFGEHGPYCRAAQGQPSIIANIITDEGEARKKVLRNFENEHSSVQSVISQCATLAEFDEQTDEWYFEAVESSLELLLELDEYKKMYPLTIEWPKGQTLNVKQTLSANNLSLSIHGSQYWFEYEGKVSIDDEQALSLKNLLDLLESSQGRFIPLGTGKFIALTEKFKKQLEELRTLSEGNRVYHLGSTALRELAEEAGTVEEDRAWATHLKKLKAMEKHQPIIPPTLQAELREYQVEGFTYLSRLAHWKIGACLADDMGLGKTIQAIALLLSHAAIGPCLVVAPSSVCFVWLDELAKFAPTLVPHTLYNASDRKALIASLGKMDILICSYGLLHQAGEVLLEKEWQMTVLDEAQAIKNPETKRWKYVTQLNSQCRIALTGTPIENHLGELWSIFRFLNPGLLGSLAFFQQRFSGPIERHHNPTAKRALKNLVSPYILRRTKSEVLLELPPKIEQSILIEPTMEETAFYEAVRMKALERIQQLDVAENNTKRFSILAEISRLRQACCHSSLVDENMTIESSKVKTFLTLVKNIIDNKHKALIFSQFTRYLTKIKEALDKENISYQYLDGSTSMKERQKAVDDFQAGIGDLFLISLKAGGTGLNLTAADYVVILDPWWNPAVEDQASARAHRMGQQRPVTVYRLIMKNSIEEKIITLHKNKKDLAADLLSGSDMSGKISEEELVGLIAG